MNLTSIWEGPTFIKFQNLGQLYVIRCRRLKCILPSTVMRSLPCLWYLWIEECEELEEIIAKTSSDEDDANYGDTIVLSSLRKIELTNLPNFKSVCQVGLQIQVELSDISICNCPKFVDSSLRWALKKLGTLSLPQASTEDSNFQTSSTAEKLCLENSMNLTSIWEGPTFIIFQNLKRLDVFKCRKLKCILPSTVMISLPCLRHLKIYECEELEEVMSSEEEEEHNRFPNNSLCFPRLRYLKVSRCRKLKWLFPSLPSTQPLPRLKWLTIEECSQVKGLLNCEPEIHEEGFYNNLLPKLISLTIKDCHIFSEATLAALQSWERQNSEGLTVDDYGYSYSYYDYDRDDDDDYNDDDDYYSYSYNDDDRPKKRRKLGPSL